MLFNSFIFALFFSIVFLIYWVVSGKRLFLQNLVLLIAGFVFYGWWDWNFLFLLAGSILFNYTIGLLINQGKSRNTRKLFLLIGLMGNIGVLLIYKYLDFFVYSFIDLFKLFGISLNFHSLKLLVPLGISFLTFLAISYLIDIYRKQLLPEKNILNISLSLSFFPIILAGPIQRPKTLLPQIKQPRIFDYAMASDGLRQILWGLFVKIVIADNCSPYVNDVFSKYGELNGSTLILGAIMFAIQIYADFSSYSDIAIGSAKLLGFRLMRNFNFPYFAGDIADFWKRWHISLTSWFRDYIFLPLAYIISRKIKSERFLLIKTDLVIYSAGIFIAWLLTGFWHGAKFTFIIWGIIHALLLIGYQSLRKPRKKFLSRYHLQHDVVVRGLERIFTLFAILIAWVFFRSDSIEMAFKYLDRSISMSVFQLPILFPVSLLFPIYFYFMVEWFQRNKQHGLEITDFSKPRALRWSLYFVLLSIMFFYNNTPQEFFYFRF